MNEKPFRPLLAADAGDLSKLPYPLFASYKIDGIRAIITPDGPRTRTMKAIPNFHISAKLDTLPRGLDGEIAVMKNGMPDFRGTTSAVMSQLGEPEFRYFVFDRYNMPELYSLRLANVCLLHLPDWVRIVAQEAVYNPYDIESLLALVLRDGYEGLILRRGDAPYKQGRSTLREAILLKVKPWRDAEACVIAFTEEFENANEAELDERGYAKRSTSKDGKIARERLGSLLVQSRQWAKAFEIGTGFTQADREQMWLDRDGLIGKLVRFKYIDTGGYDVPRHAVFQGFRAEID